MILSTAKNYYLNANEDLISCQTINIDYNFGKYELNSLLHQFYTINNNNANIKYITATPKNNYPETILLYYYSQFNINNFISAFNWSENIESNYKFVSSNIFSLNFNDTINICNLSSTTLSAYYIDTGTTFTLYTKKQIKQYPILSTYNKSYDNLIYFKNATKYYTISTVFPQFKILNKNVYYSWDLTSTLLINDYAKFDDNPVFQNYIEKSFLSGSMQDNNIYDNIQLLPNWISGDYKLNFIKKTSTEFEISSLINKITYKFKTKINTDLDNLPIKYYNIDLYPQYINCPSQIYTTSAAVTKIFNTNIYATLTAYNVNDINLDMINNSFITNNWYNLTEKIEDLNNIPDKFKVNNLTDANFFQTEYMFYDNKQINSYKLNSLYTKEKNPFENIIFEVPVNNTNKNINITINPSKYIKTININNISSGVNINSNITLNNNLSISQTALYNINLSKDIFNTNKYSIINYKNYNNLIDIRKNLLITISGHNCDSIINKDYITKYNEYNLSDLISTSLTYFNNEIYNTFNSSYINYDIKYQIYSNNFNNNIISKPLHDSFTSTLLNIEYNYIITAYNCIYNLYQIPQIITIPYYGSHINKLDTQNLIVYDNPNLKITTIKQLNSIVSAVNLNIDNSTNTILHVNKIYNNLSKTILNKLKQSSLSNFVNNNIFNLDNQDVIKNLLTNSNNNFYIKIIDDIYIYIPEIYIYSTIMPAMIDSTEDLSRYMFSDSITSSYYNNILYKNLSSEFYINYNCNQSNNINENFDIYFQDNQTLINKINTIINVSAYGGYIYNTASGQNNYTALTNLPHKFNITQFYLAVIPSTQINTQLYKEYICLSGEIIKEDLSSVFYPNIITNMYESLENLTENNYTNCISSNYYSIILTNQQLQIYNTNNSLDKKIYFKLNNKNKFGILSLTASSAIDTF